jgi:hypothetical protein
MNSVHEVKKSGKLATLCPICKNKIAFGVEKSLFADATQFPFAHVVLHGNPLHAMIVYLDANFSVRGVEQSNSIEVIKDQETFSQLIRKWSNPF